MPSLSAEVMAHLQRHSWPGNVRELEHLIQRAVVLCQNDVIEVADVPLEPSAFEQTDEVKTEKQQIVEALQATGGRIYGERGRGALAGHEPGAPAFSYARVWAATTEEAV